MWALRRTPPFKLQGLRVLTPRVTSANSHNLPGYLEGDDGTCPESSWSSASGRCGFHNSSAAKSEIALRARGFSSQAGGKSGESDSDSEDLFSELDVPPTPCSAHRNEDDLSDPELSDFDDNDDVEEASESVIGASASVVEGDERRTPLKQPPPDLFMAIIDTPGSFIQTTLEKWVEQGKEIHRNDVIETTLHLKRRRMYGRALQLLAWLEFNNKMEFTERDYAALLFLIGKLRGLQKAESFIEKVPKSFRGEVLCRALLAISVATNNLHKSEEIFNTMKDLGFRLSSFTCNQLLLLYKRLNKKKIADVLLLMETENVKPSVLTYRLLIDAKGQSHDIRGMEQIAETMKAEDIEPDVKIRALMAMHYISAGLLEKAEALLKEMEGENIAEQQWVCQSLLPIYALLGKADEVSRIWKACESKLRIEDCVAAVKAWGKLKNVDEAEAVFNKMASTWTRLTPSQYSSLLLVYAENKLLSKGIELVKRMLEDGVRIGPLAWNALVKLYVDVGEVEKADYVLQRAVERDQLKPMFSSYMVLLNEYAKRGDVHNAEKIFLRMKQSGYSVRPRQFSSLLLAYCNAKAPAYGIRDRMIADKIFPTKAFAAQLVQIDPFKRRPPVPHLLD